MTAVGRGSGCPDVVRFDRRRDDAAPWTSLFVAAFAVPGAPHLVRLIRNHERGYTAAWDRVAERLELLQPWATTSVSFRSKDRGGRAPSGWPTGMSSVIGPDGPGSTFAVAVAGYLN